MHEDGEKVVVGGEEKEVVVDGFSCLEGKG